MLAVAACPTLRAESSEAVTLETIPVWSTTVSSDSLYLGDGEISIAQPDHLSDLLRDQPGVEVGGTHSTNQRINIRGLGDTDLDIAIDGARQTGFMYHHMGNLLINPDILKAVDLRVGRNSVANSSLGGSVAFETKDPSDLLRYGAEAGARVAASYFTNDERRGSVTAYGRLGAGVDVMGYGYYTDRGNPEDGAGIEAIGNDGEIYNAMVKTGWNVDSANRLELAVDTYQDEGDYTYRPDMGRATNEAIPNSDLEYPTEFGRTSYTLNYSRDADTGTLVDATVYRNDLELERDETKIDRPVVHGELVNDGARARAQTPLQAAGMGHRLTYGATANRERSAYGEDGRTLVEEEAFSSAAYLEDRVAITDSFVVTPGVRYERYRLDSKTAERTYDDWTAALAAEYRVIRPLTLLASSTQLFKGPELAQAFINESGAYVPNPDIRPETGRNDEVGLRLAQPDMLGADDIAFSATVFRTRIEDKIESNAVGGGASQLQNVGDVEIRGFESSFRYRIGDLNLLLTHAVQDSEFDDTGEPLDREVGDTTTLSVDYFFTDLDLAFNWTSRYVAEETEVPTGSDPKAAYDTHDVSVQWLPRGSLDGLTVTFGVDNLLDEHYTSHASRTGTTVHPVFGPLELNDYEPGRNVKLTAAYRF
ncbi:TonB-dependent receptor domain-containing protein [Arhodomonas sp. AD133]|uniref:TonB-dependent receptor domain-containing protein n=1 Tax=Arhodomonas sp. AD133 TaxID=3415009 RepID=UPI003EB82996